MQYWQAVLLHFTQPQPKEKETMNILNSLGSSANFRNYGHSIPSKKFCILFCRWSLVGALILLILAICGVVDYCVIPSAATISLVILDVNNQDHAHEFKKSLWFSIPILGPILIIIIGINQLEMDIYSDTSFDFILLVYFIMTFLTTLIINLKSFIFEYSYLLQLEYRFRKNIDRADKEFILFYLSMVIWHFSLFVFGLKKSVALITWFCVIVLVTFFISLLLKSIPYQKIKIAIKKFLMAEDV